MAIPISEFTKSLQSGTTTRNTVHKQNIIGKARLSCRQKKQNTMLMKYLLSTVTNIMIQTFLSETHFVKLSALLLIYLAIQDHKEIAELFLTELLLKIAEVIKYGNSAVLKQSAQWHEVFLDKTSKTWETRITDFFEYSINLNYEKVITGSDIIGAKCGPQTELLNLSIPNQRFRLLDKRLTSMLGY